jgi:intein/homing endonuclease
LVYSLHKKETALIAKIKNFFGKKFVSVYSQKECNGIHVVVFRSEYASIFNNLFGSGARKKYIHHSVFGISEKCRKSFFDGYMLGDGCYVRKHRQAKTSSIALVYGLCILGESLGYNSSFYKFKEMRDVYIRKRKIKSKNFYYNITFHSVNNWNRDKRKPSKPMRIIYEGNAYSLRYVKYIKSKPYCGLVWNLSVAGSHTFQTAIGMSHNTVKPLKLTEYLAKLLLPPKEYSPRRILVPFAGSASEMIGCLLAGWDEVVGVELTPEYIPIAEARLQYWADVQNNKQEGIIKVEVKNKKVGIGSEKEKDTDQMELF